MERKTNEAVLDEVNERRKMMNATMTTEIKRIGPRLMRLLRCVIYIRRNRFIAVVVEGKINQRKTT